ncbi:MAG TPA: zinc-ribbon and DUF3426 domain-containing protein [Rhodanobacteraceae bacterium]|nr:zinc-ribbon and DUF3426 domain-containing protein [Rhodanobacteraceae bacterium]
MYTQCPQCRTIFEINEDALQASLGIVRCGHCAERFDALRTLSDSLPAGPDAALPEHDPDVLAPTLTAAVTPVAVQAAAGLPREPVSGTGDPAAAAPPDATWLDTLSADRAHALIADAAGIPPEAIQGDPAWQLTDLPVQASFAELDIIPVATAAPATDIAEPAPPAPAHPDIEAAASEPFTGAWGLDLPAVGLTASTGLEEHSPSDATGLPTADDAWAQYADDSDIAVPLAPAEAESDPDPWLPEGQLRAGDRSPPAGAMEAQHESRDAAAEPAGVAEPVYVPPRRRRIRRSDGLWAAGCAVLALALAAQVAWTRRVALVRDPATQAQALRVCARFDCKLPPIRDTAKLELLSRDIRPDPDAAGALAITATFRNDAPYRQPWPIVVVELTDLDSNVVAMRRFRPAEYMPDAARRAAGIAAGTTAAVAFEVVDPGKRAVSFHFGFE